MRAQIGTLIIATSGVQLANGFFGTFISLRVAIEDFDATMAGLVLNSYFAFHSGALRYGRIIERVGHIRAYASFAGLVVATAAMPFLVEQLPWLVLRAVFGFGCAGVFITTESWLNAKAGGGARAGLLGLHGRDVRCVCGVTTPDRPGRDRNSSTIQCDRRPVRGGAGHAEHAPGRTTPVDRFLTTISRAPHPSPSLAAR